MAWEVIATTGLVMVMGEITTSCYVDIPKVVRETIKDIGYDKGEYGFDCETCAVITSIDEQSDDIALGVNEALESKKKIIESDVKEIGAGDQGMMFGYACDETPELMPMPIYIAHKLTERLTGVRKKGILNYLRPDGKSQVTVEYDGDKPVRIDTIVISSQHSEDIEHDQIERDIIEHVIKPVIPDRFLDEKTKFFINPHRKICSGRCKGDSGLTGRKIIVDTYGGMGRHGGGAFSGKDPTKVDRTAAYAARYVAKNIVAAGIAKRVEVQLAYAIGVAYPVSILIDTFGTGKIPDDKISELVAENFDLRPAAMINMLDLRRPIFRKTAAYGHFGRNDPDFTWERTDKADILRKAGLSH